MFSRGAATFSSTSSTGRIVDEEFGDIVYRRSPQARYVRVRVTEDGRVRASLPKRAPLSMVRELVDSSRSQIRKLVETQKAKRVAYETGMQIGHSHKLQIRYATNIVQPRGRVSGQVIDIVLPAEHPSDETQSFLSRYVRKALDNEAKAFLPRRLRHLADQFGFEYEKVRFGNQTGRWGSCSSTGTISLNVALMNTPAEVIDYVLIHELAHTRHMNHSNEFWQLVGECLPNYQTHRKTLKTMSPIC